MGLAIVVFALVVASGPSVVVGTAVMASLASQSGLPTKPINKPGI